MGPNILLHIVQLSQEHHIIRTLTFKMLLQEAWIATIRDKKERECILRNLRKTNYPGTSLLE